MKLLILFYSLLMMENTRATICISNDLNLKNNCSCQGSDCFKLIDKNYQLTLQRLAAKGKKNEVKKILELSTATHQAAELLMSGKDIPESLIKKVRAENDLKGKMLKQELNELEKMRKQKKMRPFELEKRVAAYNKAMDTLIPFKLRSDRIKILASLNSTSIPERNLSINANQVSEEPIQAENDSYPNESTNSNTAQTNHDQIEITESLKQSYKINDVHQDTVKDIFQIISNRYFLSMKKISSSAYIQDERGRERTLRALESVKKVIKEQ